MALHITELNDQRERFTVKLFVKVKNIIALSSINTLM